MVTGIPIAALQDQAISTFSIDTRLSWAVKRQTKRQEDAAYSLLGLFDVQMPLIYGEGRNKAFQRLKKEIALLPEADSRNDRLQLFVRKFVLPEVSEQCHSIKKPELTSRSLARQIRSCSMNNSSARSLT